MLPSLCMDLTGIDHSGVAWHGLVLLNPRPPMGCISARPSTCLPGPAWQVGGAETRNVYLQVRGPMEG